MKNRCKENPCCGDPVDCERFRPASSAMTLDEFVEEETKRARRFADYWRAEQKRGGKDNWPDEMPPGEWDQQYMAWMDDGDR